MPNPCSRDYYDNPGRAGESSRIALRIFADCPPMVVKATGPAFMPRLTARIPGMCARIPTYMDIPCYRRRKHRHGRRCIPPILANAAGPSIYTAQTGVQFDLYNALQSPGSTVHGLE
jgi:hypothetical protein